MIVHEFDTDEVKAVLLSHANAKFPSNPVNTIAITSRSTFPDEMHPLLVVRVWWDPIVNGRKPKQSAWKRLRQWVKVESHTAKSVAQELNYRSS